VGGGAPSGALATGGEKKWVQLAYSGTFRGHASGEFTLSRAVFSEVIRNFEDRGLPVPWDVSHSSEDPDQNWRVEVSAAKGYTWALRLGAGGDTLEGLSQITDPAALAAVRSGALAWCSPAFRLNSRHPVTGERIGARLTSVALTAQPFLSKLPKLALTDAARAAEARVDTLLADPLCGFTAADRASLVRMATDDPAFYERTVARRPAPAHLAVRLTAAAAHSAVAPRAPKPAAPAAPAGARPTAQPVGTLARPLDDLSSAEKVRHADAVYAGLVEELAARRAAEPPPPPAAPRPTPFDLALPTAARAAEPGLYEALEASREAVAGARAGMAAAKATAVRTGKPAGLVEAAGELALAEAQAEAVQAAVADHELAFPARWRGELERRHADELAALERARVAVPLASIDAAVAALAAALVCAADAAQATSEAASAAAQTGRLLAVTGAAAEPRVVTQTDVRAALETALAKHLRTLPTSMLRATVEQALRAAIIHLPRPKRA
jgi:hypothetical protein